MNPEAYSYLQPLIAAERGNEAFLRQVLNLAKSGIDEHVATIETICGSEGDAPGTEKELQILAVAVHRLTNVMIALRLEELARRLNVVEGAARGNDRGAACREYRAIDSVVQNVAEEIDRGLNEVIRE
jgi:hypothetical protein